MASAKKIKGRAWRNTSPVKGSLNEVVRDMTICFCEKQKDGTQDVVNLIFRLQGEQYGEYAEEFLPDTVMKNGHNVIDITALLMDEKNDKGIWYLLDVKKDVGGEDVIFHLMEQWKYSYQYLRNSVLNYVSSITFSDNLGVITRNFDEQRIRKAIASKEQVIHDCDVKAIPSIAQAKKRNDNIKLKQEMKYLSDFLDRKFFYKDNLESRCFLFQVILESTEDEEVYQAEIEMRIEQ